MASFAENYSRNISVLDIEYLPELPGDGKHDWNQQKWGINQYTKGCGDPDGLSSQAKYTR